MHWSIVSTTLSGAKKTQELYIKKPSFCSDYRTEGNVQTFRFPEDGLRQYLDCTKQIQEISTSTLRTIQPETMKFYIKNSDRTSINFIVNCNKFVIF